MLLMPHSGRALRGIVWSELLPTIYPIMLLYVYGGHNLLLSYLHPGPTDQRCYAYADSETCAPTRESVGQNETMEVTAFYDANAGSKHAVDSSV